MKQRICGFLLLVGCVCTGFGQNVLDNALKEAAPGILSAVPAQATIAVPYFDVQSKAIRDQAAVVVADYIQAELSSLLVNSKRVRVLERQKINMDQVNGSLEFDASGMVSDESAQGIGHFLGVQYLVLGSLKSVGSGFQLYIDTVRVETSEKVASFSKSIDRSAFSRFAGGDWESGQSGNGQAGRTRTVMRSDTGVYVGIVSFGPDAEDITGGAPILLNANGFKQVNDILDNRYKRTTRPGTALYYGVHLGMANASANAGIYPANLENVYLVTFTDGIDMGSTGFNLAMLEHQDFGGAAEEEYRQYIVNQIQNRPIAGRPIIAYSAGVRGSDVTDGAYFTSSVSSLATSRSNFYELTNFSQLNGRFDDISKNLIITTEVARFTLRTPSLSRGTKVRMTFDTVSGAEQSVKYVEGVVSAENRGYSLTDIQYRGTGSTTGSRVRGVMDGNEVLYRFEGFTGYGAGVKQWIQRSGSTAWQVNSEYVAGNTVETETEYKSAVVYLVLDASASLKAGDVDAVRTAAKQFIKTLYDRSRGVSVVAAQPAPTPAPAPAPAPAAVSVPVGFVRIPGGTFMMGSPSSEVDRSSSEVQHSVTVSSFYMSKYEVTQKEWTEVMGSNPSYFKGDTLPVECVSWYDVIEYCNKRSVKEGLTPAYTINKGVWDNNNTNSDDNVHWQVTWNRQANGYRLPTEAEWEYACRGGSTTPFSTGNNITTNQANYNGNYPYNNGPKGTYRGKTWAVGSGAPNGFGLYDMHGNVWEWCWDWYGAYSTGSQSDPMGAVSGADRVLRGGSWGYGGLFLRSAYRDISYAAYRNYDLGCRLVRP